MKPQDLLTKGKVLFPNECEELSLDKKKKTGIRFRIKRQAQKLDREAHDESRDLCGPLTAVSSCVLRR